MSDFFDDTSRQIREFEKAIKDDRREFNGKLRKLKELQAERDEAFRKMEESSQETSERIKRLRATVDERVRDRHQGVRRITVNKRTHRLRFVDETESEVTIVIEPKG